MQGRAVLGDVEQSFLEVVLGLRGKNEKPLHWLVDVARWRSSVITSVRLKVEQNQLVAGIA
jgi:hypothetical protein